MIHCTTLDSPLGELLLAGTASPASPGGIALTSVSVPGQKGGGRVQPDGRRDPGPFAEAARQFEQYFAGERSGFDRERAVRGTEFRTKVWRALDAVPYGTTTTYGAIAEAVGVAGPAVRAVGGAVGANPLLVIRPCHRVIGADGSLTGYAGGLERKRLLLALERGR